MNRPGLDMGFGAIQQGGPSANPVQPTRKFKDRFMPPGFQTLPGNPGETPRPQPLPNQGAQRPTPQPLPYRPQPGIGRPVEPGQPFQKMPRPGVISQPMPSSPQRGVGLDMDGRSIYEGPRPVTPQPQQPVGQGFGLDPQMLNFFQQALAQGFHPQQIQSFLQSKAGIVE